MKKAFRKFAAWFMRLNDRQIAWSQKHPILDAVCDTLFVFCLYLLTACGFVEFCPDWQSIVEFSDGSDVLTPFEYWSFLFFLGGTCFGYLGWIWTDALLLKKKAAEKKEAAE